MLSSARVKTAARAGKGPQASLEIGNARRRAMLSASISSTSSNVARSRLSASPLSHNASSLAVGRMSLAPPSAFDRDVYRRVPPPPGPPPPLTEPAPPPPPPPPPRLPKLLQGNGWIGALLALSGLWWAFLINQPPQLQTGSDGFEYVETAGGNRVLFAEDEAGRVFLVDADGNLYYDSGDDRVGWYIVDSRDGEITNVFFGGPGDVGGGREPQRRVVGNIRDLRTVEASGIAGIPLEKIKDIDRFMRGTSPGGRPSKIVGFAPSPKFGREGGTEDDGVPLPPNAPVKIGRNGLPRGPAILEEGVMTLEKKGGGALKDKKGDKLDQLVALSDAARESGTGIAAGSPDADAK